MIILYIHIFGFFRNELFSSYLLGVQNDVEKITFISLGTVDDGSCKYFCGSVPLISWEESRECTIRCWIKLPKQPSRFFQLVLFGGNWEMDIFIFILFKKLYNVKNNYFNWKTLFVFISGIFALILICLTPTLIFFQILFTILFTITIILFTI